MNDQQNSILAHLRTQQVAMTAREIAEAMQRPLRETLDDLRALEDAGQVCGAEMGWYRVPNTLRKRGR